MPSKCIVSTRPDGGVTITHPTAEIMAIFTQGGAPDGYFVRVDWDRQIELMIESGKREIVAIRWVKCLRCGGLTTAEAYELVRDRDTDPTWTANELWDRADIPSDRWFRDAWCRSHNGGPLCISLPRARSIQFRKITGAISAENKRRENDIDLFDSPLECDVMQMRERIRRAQDELDLRAVWPEGLSRG